VRQNFSRLGEGAKSLAGGGTVSTICSTEVAATRVSTDFGPPIWLARRMTATMRPRTPNKKRHWRVALAGSAFSALYAAFLEPVLGLHFVSPGHAVGSTYPSLQVRNDAIVQGSCYDRTSAP
jgi:hypothetical protein